MLGEIQGELEGIEQVERGFYHVCMKEIQNKKEKEKQNAKNIDDNIINYQKKPTSFVI